MTAMPKIAEALRRQKSELDISASQIARMAGVSRSSVCRVLSGKHERCRLRTLTAVARVIGIEIGVINAS